MILLDHVTKLYGRVIGANDLHTNLEQGAYGLIGPNGSGKTTLLNLLTGTLRPTIGTVKVFGQIPTRRRNVLRRIGLCPASDILLPNVTGLEWVTYLVSLHGIASGAAAARAKESLEKVGIGGAMTDRMGSYSLGMRQRIKLAQAIAHDPDLLILDEPFNGLDPIGRHSMTEFLKEWSQSGRGLILASHILHEVEAVTRSFLLIHGGRLLASGAAAEVQSMLVGFPQEIRLTGTGLDELAKSVVQYPWIESMSFTAGRDGLVLHVREPQKFFEELVRLARQPGVAIHSLESSQGSLEAAFEALLRRHRGEM